MGRRDHERGRLRWEILHALRRAADSHRHPMTLRSCLHMLLLAVVVDFTPSLCLAEINSEAMRRARTAAEGGDFPAAIEILKEEAAKGSPEAANALGELHFSGKGVKASPSEAARWFQQAVDASY